MPVKVKRRTASDKAAAPVTKRKTTAAKKSKIGCLFAGSPSCPRVREQASPYAYQKGCRAKECFEVNAEYYREFRAKQREERERAARKAAAARKKKRVRKAA